MCTEITTKYLLDFITREVLTFKNSKIIRNGIAYHYTTYAKEIIELNKFYGAPINNNLDRTQVKIPSEPATNDPGAVFAYEKIEDAEEEGFKSSILKIEYFEAIWTMHSQEVSFSEAPPTIIILNTQIKKFELIK